MTSKWEAFGIVPIEAMQFGVPIVSTNMDAPPEIIEVGVTGPLIYNRYSNAIAKAVSRLVDDPCLRLDLDGAGSKVVREYFLEEQMLRDLVKVYQNVCDV